MILPRLRVAPLLVAVLMAQAMLHPCVAANAPAAEKQPAPAVPTPEETPSYEPRLLRLAEILGALSYLQDLCRTTDSQAGGQIWRAQMTALMDAEGTTQLRKERLAGAYNRGFRGYEVSYRRCTPNAQTIISRFLDESSKLAHDIAQRNGAS
jgi:uncharacterized protein (TIGR02301 family)